MPHTPSELRRQAELIRQAAAMPTSGGHRTNKMLRQIATKLETKAEAIEAKQPVEDESA